MPIKKVAKKKGLKKAKKVIKNGKNKPTTEKAKTLDLQNSKDIKRFLISIKKQLDTKVKTCNYGIRYKFSHTKNQKTTTNIFDLVVCEKVENKKKFLNIKITDNSKNGICLTMNFHKKKKHTKYSGVYGFQKSKIELLARGICGYDPKKKTINMSGSYVLNVANALNDIFQVDIAILEDDSRLNLCDTNVSIKILNLLKYGKTWYEREGNYVLDEKEIYKRAELVGNMTVKKLYDTLQEIDNDILKSDIFDFKKLTHDNIKKVEKILEQLAENKNSKIKTIFNKAFDRNSPLKECDQYFLWSHILQLNPRKYIEKTKDEKYKFMKDYYEFASDAYHFSASTRKIKK